MSDKDYQDKDVKDMTPDDWTVFVEDEMIRTDERGE
jgi:hypothetical protein